MAELLVKVTDDQAARSALEEQYLILGYRNAHGLELLHSVPYFLIRVCFSFASPRSVIGQQNLRQFSDRQTDRQTDRHLYLIIKLRVVPSGAKSEK